MTSCAWATRYCFEAARILKRRLKNNMKEEEEEETQHQKTNKRRRRNDEFKLSRLAVVTKDAMRRAAERG